MTGSLRLVNSSEEGHFQIRDPMAKGDVFYDIPFHKIISTAALKGKGHRSCLCRLYLKGRCGQGKKCKSFHVDPNYVSNLRIKHGVEIDEDFITEVAVFNDVERRSVFAVRFPAVMRTKGLDDYRREFSNKRINPKRLCNSDECKKNEDCEFIHVKEAELQSLNAKRLRTPCCEHHGDRHDIRIGASIQLDGNQIIIPSNLLAWNEAARRIAKGHMFTIRDVCKPHITGRCKYGKSCGHLHVCRVWWEKRYEMPNTNTNTIPSVAESVMSITPNSTPSVTPLISPRCELLREESFGLPFWNQNSPPPLGVFSTDPSSPLLLLF